MNEAIEEGMLSYSKAGKGHGIGCRRTSLFWVQPHDDPGACTAETYKCAHLNRDAKKKKIILASLGHNHLDDVESFMPQIMRDCANTHASSNSDVPDT